LEIPCIWFSAEYCAQWARVQKKTTSQAKAEVYFVGRKVGYDAETRRHKIMVPDDIEVYEMSDHAYKTYESNWRKHGKIMTQGYYRMKHGKVIDIVQAADMEDDNDFEERAGGEDSEDKLICCECDEEENLITCNECNEELVCTIHTAPGGLMCMACYATLQQENNDDDDGFDEDDDGRDREREDDRARLGIAGEFDDGGMYIWKCNECDTLRHATQTICQGCGKRKVLINAHEHNMDDERALGHKALQIVIERNEGPLSSNCIVCNTWGRTMTRCMNCNNTCCQDHWSGDACDNCSIEISEKLKDAICHMCGREDNRDTEEDQERLRRCSTCEFAYCGWHGDDHMETCTKCLQQDPYSQGSGERAIAGGDGGGPNIEPEELIRGTGPKRRTNVLQKGGQVKRRRSYKN
jgi:hypothetical protein